MAANDELMLAQRRAVPSRNYRRENRRFKVSILKEGLYKVTIHDYVTDETFTRCDVLANSCDGAMTEVLKRINK